MPNERLFTANLQVTVMYDPCKIQQSLIVDLVQHNLENVFDSSCPEVIIRQESRQCLSCINREEQPPLTVIRNK